MTYYVNATRLLLSEMKQKHMEMFDMLISWDSISKKFDIDAKSNAVLTWETRKLRDNELLAKRSNTELGIKQRQTLFPDFYPKYQHFSGLIGDELDEAFVEIKGLKVYRTLLDRDLLEGYKFECEQKLVQCDSWLFSLPTMLSRNTEERDKTMIEALGFDKEQTELSKKDLLKKLEIVEILLNFLDKWENPETLTQSQTK